MVTVVPPQDSVCVLMRGWEEGNVMNVSLATTSFQGNSGCSTVCISDALPTPFIHSVVCSASVTQQDPPTPHCVIQLVDSVIVRGMS